MFAVTRDAVLYKFSLPSDESKRESLLFAQLQPRVELMTTTAHANRVLAHGRKGIVQERSAKLSMKGDGAQASYAISPALPHLLFAASAEQLVRVWSLQSDESYVLPIAENLKSKEGIELISINPSQRILAAASANVSITPLFSKRTN